MKNKIFSFLFVFFCVTVAFSQNKEKTKAPSSYQNTEFHTDYKPNYKNDGLNKPVKNVILLIGDGMGLAQASAGMYANHNRWVLSIPFFISCIRQQNPLTVLSKIILRKVKQFNLPPPKKK